MEKKTQGVLGAGIAENIEFEISDRKNDIVELKSFLNSKVKGLIGFNNINFDYPVLHNTILSNNVDWKASDIFEEVQLIIDAKYSSIPDWKTKIPQLDLFKIWHYDNKNKSCSLKWLEFAMRMDNIEDLPYSPDTILTSEQMDEVKSYCRNDIKATEMFYKLSEKHISIRSFYKKKEGINLINASETKIAKDVFAKYLSKELGIEIKELRDLRTIRKKIEIKDVIFDYINFNDSININVLNFFKTSNWVDTSSMSKSEAKKYTIKKTVNYKNVVREYAEGGLHSFGKSGVYESDDNHIIVDVDFASFYPHLTFMNKLHPKHIPEEVFNKIYKGFYEERKHYPKSDPRNYVLKILLNALYGLSKDINSYFYDPKWQLAVVINGQLILTLLTEKIFENISEGLIIFENTDGAAYRIKKSELHLLEKACKEVENIVNIGLEIQVCEKMILRDCNNYINIISDDNVKFKGAYEIDRDYHKNHSKRIVAIGAANYFINDIEPYITLKEHLRGNDYSFAKNYGIFDFCIGSKMKGANILNERIIHGTDIKDIPLGKVNRYYVSRTGNQLIKILPPLEKSYKTDTDKFKEKHPNQLNMFDFIEDETLVNPKDRETNLEAGWQCTLFNRYKEKDDYNLSYKYYLNEVNKLIDLE
jgi:hypothetical protein